MFNYFRNCSSSAHQVCGEDSPTKGRYDHCQSNDLDLHSSSQLCQLVIPRTIFKLLVLQSNWAWHQTYAWHVCSCSFNDLEFDLDFKNVRLVPLVLSLKVLPFQSQIMPQGLETQACLWQAARSLLFFNGEASISWGEFIIGHKFLFARTYRWTLKSILYWKRDCQWPLQCITFPLWMQNIGLLLCFLLFHFVVLEMTILILWISIFRICIVLLLIYEHC